MGKKNNVLLDESLIETLENMDSATGYEFVLGLLRYGIYGTEPTFSNKVLDIVFPAFKNKINYNKARYDRCVENGKKGAEYGKKGAEYGKKGGRPRKGETREMYLERKSLETPKIPLKGIIKTPQETPLTVTDTVTDTETVLEPTLKKDYLNNNYFNKEKEIITTNINNLVNKESGGFEKGGFDSFEIDEDYYEKQNGNLVFDSGVYEEEQELNYWAE